MPEQYIITYKEEEVSYDSAAEVLGVSTESMQNGVSVLSSDKPESTKDILHFDTLGTTVMSLSKKQVENLEHDDRVAEVVPDIEVFAHGGQGGLCGGAEEDWDDDWDEEEVTELSEDDLYIAGYQQALSDMAQGGQAAWPVPFPPFPSSPFPISRPPFPPISTCPPGFIRLGNRCVRIPTTVPRQPIPWNISMVNAHRVWHRVTGRGVKVGIVDTGIDNNHPDLSVSGGASFVPGVVSWDDDHGHGTHCAGIAGARNNRTGVVGVAPRCSLYAIKVLRPVAGGRASGLRSWILAGMEWALQQRMDIVSMSLGGEAGSANEDCILAYQRAAQRLINQRCIVISSAGNSFDRPPPPDPYRPWVGQPARCRGFMAVAAVDRNSRLAGFSSRGPAHLCAECGVEISAPGVNIRSTVPGGGYRGMSGTSMAAPHVSGAAALLKELHPTWSPALIRARLKVTARDLGAPGDDPGFGAGLLDCRRAVFG